MRHDSQGRLGRSRIADGNAAGRQAWCGARCDGNDDGNAGRRARFWLNGYAQLIGAEAILTRAPICLESESALAGRADLRDGRERGTRRPPTTSRRATTRPPLGRAWGRRRRYASRAAHRRPRGRAAPLSTGCHTSPRCGLAEQTRREPRASGRHVPYARAGTRRSTSTPRRQPSAVDRPRPRSGRSAHALAGRLLLCQVPVPGKIKCCPRRAGRSARMRVRFIPLTSLRAYHTTPRAQSWTSSAGGGCRGLHPGRRAVGRCQVNGMKLEADGCGFRRPRRGSRSSRRCAGGGRPRGRGGV